MTEVPTTQSTSHAEARISVDAGRSSKCCRLFRWEWGLVALVILGASLIRVRFLDCPLERDEGEYAYAGQLIRQGVPPYQLVYNMKLPGTYAAYALLMAMFGTSTVGIHLGLIVVNSVTIVLVFLVGRQLFDVATGLLACATFALLSLGPGVNGLAAHATHFVTICAAGGALMLLRAVKSSRRCDFFYCGLLFGLAFVMKQPGVFFSVFGLLIVLWDAWRSRSRSARQRLTRVALYAAGVVIPFILNCVILALAGVFDRFWFWTFSYAREYVTQLPLSNAVSALANASREALGPTISLWYLAAIGLLAIWLKPGGRCRAAFVLGLLFFSFLAVCPGLYFRPHYFIVMLPAVALLVGAAVTVAGNVIGRMPGFAPLRVVPALTFCAAFGLSLLGQRQTFFHLSADEVCRQTYGIGNPFVETREVAKYITQHSSPTDTVAILGSEPQLFFYAERRSATGFIYMYPLMEKQIFALTMQQDMIREIESARPRFLIIVDSPHSTWLGPHSEQALVRWADPYIAMHYQIVGLAAIDRDATQYFWDEQLQTAPSRSQYAIRVFKRNAAE